MIVVRSFVNATQSLLHWTDKSHKMFDLQLGVKREGSYKTFLMRNSSIFAIKIFPPKSNIWGQVRDTLWPHIETLQ
jgi:hypothetical protein